MKVGPLTRISSPAPEICSNVLLTKNVFYMEKSIPVPPWSNGKHSHFGGQHPSRILGVYVRSGV